jgi:putative ABC transport system ATP-binding protein
VLFEYFDCERYRWQDALMPKHSTSPSTPIDKDILVRVSHVSRVYRMGAVEVPAVLNLSVEIRRGEFTALIGASGSGKTTLLNLIGCLDQQDSGEIEIEGVHTKALDEVQASELRNRKIGFIFQSFNLIPVLDVFENVELPLVIRKDISAADRRARALQAIEDVGLTQFITHRPDQLSGGQRQRVAIARALVSNPSLILADEPTANLDSKTANLIIDLMIKLNKEKGVTFFFCSHDEKLISRVDRVIRIHDGQVVQ